VVRSALHEHAPTGRPKRHLSAAVFLVAIVALPINVRSRSSIVGGSAGRSSPAPWAENQGYDPAAASFSSLLSFGAMSVIAPAIFGDFQSPGAVSLTPLWSGTMQQGAGLDAAVSTMLNGVVQQDLLPTGGALIAEEFGIASSLDSGAGAATPSATSRDINVDVPTVTGDISDSTIETRGAKSICGEDEVADTLQAGSGYWNDPRTGLVEARLAIAQFPRGAVAGPVTVANPLGGLGPSGDRSNLVSLGPAGGWCRPGRESFWLSSPLEDDLLWIACSTALGAVLVALLSRGARLPAI
jgi:hypothetical protein